MKSEGIQIRVSDFLHAVKKHRMLIIALTAAGLIIGIILSGVSYLKGEMSKEYVITGSIAVSAQLEDGSFSSKNNFANTDDIKLATSLVDSVMYVLKSDKTLTATVDRLGLLGVTVKDIYNNLTLTQYDETQIIEMSLYWRSAQEGISILEAVNEVAPDILRETLHVGSVSVINDPSARYLVGGSLNASLWGYMAVFGLMVGVGIAVLELFVRPTLLKTKDLEEKYGLEVLGEVPDNAAFFRKKTSPLMVEDREATDVTESFASIAHILRNRIGTKEKHSRIYITSASRNEGKTIAAANLAVQLSDMEKRVLLIDFDMRNPMLGSMFLGKVDYSHSLNALYRGEITMEEAITSLTGYLDILPTVLERNTIPLDSTIFDLVEKLSENYDYILMDTAPVGLAANTMSLNQVATNALFVVRFDTSSVQEIRDALDRLDKSGVRLLGSIFNGVKVSESGMRKHQKETYAQTLAKEEKDSQNILEEAINETQPDNSEETFIPSEEPEDIQETLAYNATTEDFIRQLMKVEMQENEPMREDSDTPEDGDADEEK